MGARLAVDPRLRADASPGEAEKATHGSPKEVVAQNLHYLAKSLESAARSTAWDVVPSLPSKGGFPGLDLNWRALQAPQPAAGPAEQEGESEGQLPPAPGRTAAREDFRQIEPPLAQPRVPGRSRALAPLE